MSEHLKLVKENSYLKLGIINLIEALEDVYEFREIKSFLRDLIDGVEQNTRKENAEAIKRIFNELESE